jgi:hypothetical protein
MVDGGVEIEPSAWVGQARSTVKKKKEKKKNSLRNCV